MQIGIMPLFGGETAEAEYVARMARGIEERGFHAMWAVDHILIPKEVHSQYPYQDDGEFPVDPTLQGLEPFALLSFFAAHTRRLRLATGVVVLPQRNPLLTAKQAADTDVLSGGRLDFGIGVGWLAEEFAALGVPFERRGARSDAYLRMMQAVWTNELVSWEDEFWTLPECWLHPKPVQKPHPPLYFGGESRVALRRVARFGHWYGLDVLPEQVPEKLALLRELCEEAGRDVADVKIAVGPYAHPCDRDMLRRYEDAGVDQVVMAAFVPGQDAMERAIDDIAERLIA